MVPDDPDFGKLWGLQNTGQVVNGRTGTNGADIKAVKAWDLATGSNLVVAIIDTGVDYNHVDLKANIWTAPIPFTVNIGGRAIDCAAGTHGFNAIKNNCDPMDDSASGKGGGHGTHVAGTVGAVGNNHVGVTGVNQLVRIMAIKFLDKDGSGATSDAINAIEFAIQAKKVLGLDARIRIISASYGGGDFSQAELDEITLSGSNDIMFVAAAGNSGRDNDNTPFYPASYGDPSKPNAAHNVISIAATNNKDELASFSNTGASSVWLAAPGVDIFSTLPGDRYGFLSGTSQATPHVSGAAALIMNKCSALTAAGAISDIWHFVDKLDSLTKKVSSEGRLNVRKVLDECAFTHGGPFCPGHGPSCVKECIPKCEAESGPDCVASCECCCTKAKPICFPPPK